jgi:hypothetical protein
MEDESNCWIEFEIIDREQIKPLVAVIEALNQDDDLENCDIEFWGKYFPEFARTYFRWSESETEAVYLARRMSYFKEMGWAGSYLLKRRPDLEDMICAIKNQDYELVSCRHVTDTLARLEYHPFGFPYGGPESLIDLVLSFGFKVTQINRGFGPESFPHA